MFTLDAVQRSKLARALHRLAEPERRWLQRQLEVGARDALIIVIIFSGGIRGYLVVAVGN